MLFGWHVRERPCLWAWRRLHQKTVPMRWAYLLAVSLN